MQLCQYKGCNSKAEFYEYCQFRGYEKFLFCFTHRREEEKFHKDNHVLFPCFQILANLSKRR